MNLTKWYKPYQQPIRIGVYQRDYGYDLTYCYWDGTYWFIPATTPYHAVTHTIHSDEQFLPWRGLIE